jgi:hypothetical protein
MCGTSQYVLLPPIALKMYESVETMNRDSDLSRHSVCLLVWVPDFVLNSNVTSSVGIRTRLRTGRLRSRGLIPALYSTQPPIQCVLGAISPGIMCQGREADHSPPSNAEIKNNGAIPPLPHISSWRGV